MLAWPDPQTLAWPDPQTSPKPKGSTHGVYRYVKRGIL